MSRQLWQWRTRRRGVGSYTALLTTLLLAACTGSDPRLTVSDFHGCDDLRVDSDGGYVCGILREHAKKYSAVSFVMAAPDGWKTPVVHGVAAARLGPHPRGASVQLPLAGAALPFDARVIAEPPWYKRGAKLLRLRVEWWADLPELGPPDPTLEKVKEAQARYSQDDAAQARLLNTRADLELDKGLTKESAQHFEQSLQKAQQSGLLTIAANSARRLAFHYFRGERNISKAESVLQENAGIIHMIALDHAFEIYNRGIFAEERGQLAAATTLFTAAHSEAARLENPELRHLTQLESAFVLAQQGLNASAEASITQFSAELARHEGEWESCERAHAYNLLGWTRLLMKESFDAVTADPIELLSAGLDAKQNDRCDDTYNEAHIHLNLARAHLMVAWRSIDRPAQAAAPSDFESRLADTRKHLISAAAIEKQPDLAMRLDLAELSGRLELLEKRPDKALDHFSRLVAEARSAQDPDYTWRALIGLARANVALAESAPAVEVPRHVQAASAAFEEAEQSLDARLWLVPLSAARRTFVPRFTTGTALYVAWLLRKQQPQQALTVVRKAQLRGLYSTLGVDVLSIVPEPQRSRLLATREEHRKLREQIRDAEPGSAADLSAQALAKLGELFGQLKATGVDWLTLHALKPGEAMFTCHPLPGAELACFASAGHEVKVQILSEAALQQAKKETPLAVSQLLLAPFVDIVESARVLRIIPNRAIRGVDFALLPFRAANQPLASPQRSVVYALDLEPVRRASAGAPTRRAMLLANLAVKTAAKVTPLLYRQLSDLGWNVDLYSSVRSEYGFNLTRWLRCHLGILECPPPLNVPVEPSFGGAGPVLAALPGVSLAHFYTHAAYAVETGYQSSIMMPDRSRITVGDILTLEQVPRLTILIACQGGMTTTGDDADDISLAQAFLLSGGEAVLASLRELEPELGELWSKAIYEAMPETAQGPYMAAPNADAVSAYGAALTNLRKSGVSANALGALRLFVL